MKLPLCISLMVFGFLLTGCYRYGLYQHPMLINSSPYQAIPLKKDSSKSALYASGSIMGGYANHLSKDGMGALQASIHQGTNFGSFQAHYGLNGSFGFYRASDYGELGNYYYNSNLNNYLIDSLNGTKSFGSIGVSAGINTVIPFDDGGEWRIVGLEFSHQYELGNSYYGFRRKLSIQDVNLVEHSRHYSTLGLSSELILKFNESENLGYKILMGASLQHPRFYESYTSDFKPFRTFLQQYLFYKHQRTHFYLQAAVGYYSFSGILGFNYQLR